MSSSLAFPASGLSKSYAHPLTSSLLAFELVKKFEFSFERSKVDFFFGSVTFFKFCTVFLCAAIFALASACLF